MHLNFTIIHTKVHFFYLKTAIKLIYNKYIKHLWNKRYCSYIVSEKFTNIQKFYWDQLREAEQNGITCEYKESEISHTAHVEKISVN